MISRNTNAAYAMTPDAERRTFETDARWCKNCGQGISMHRDQIHCPAQASMAGERRRHESAPRSQQAGEVDAGDTAQMEEKGLP